MLAAVLWVSRQPLNNALNNGAYAAICIYVRNAFKHAVYSTINSKWVIELFSCGEHVERWLHLSWQQLFKKSSWHM